MPDADPTLERLEDQIGWYDRKSNSNQRTFKRMKVTEILAAALVPLFAGFKLPWLAGGSGALIAVLESSRWCRRNTPSGRPGRSKRQKRRTITDAAHRVAFIAG